MAALMEHAGRLELNVTKVRKMNPRRNLRVSDNLRKVVLEIRAERSGAKRKAVIDAVIQGGNLLESLLARYDSRKAEYRPGGIVGMNGHLDLINT